MSNSIRVFLLSLTSLSAAALTLPLVERVQQQLTERTEVRSSGRVFSACDALQNESGKYKLVDYKFTELDTTHLGKPFANSSPGNPSSGSAVTTPQPSPPPSLNQPAPVATFNEPAAQGGGVTPNAVSSSPPPPLPTATANDQYGLPADSAKSVGEFAPQTTTGAGAPRSRWGQSSNPYGNTTGNTKMFYQPLRPGPPAYMAVPPRVPGQNGVAQPLSEYNSPKRPGQPWSPWGGKTVDESIHNSGWQRAKQRDAQGLPGVAVGNGRYIDTPPVAEDKEPKTPDEMARLAYWYWKTERISKLPLAVELMTKAAESGNSRAQAILADWYDRGIRDTLPVDESKALYWNTKAAAQGQRNAQLYMGLYYSEGRLTAKNPKMAFDYFQKAANQHYAPAEMAVAQAYCVGEGVAENHALGIQWFEKAQADGSNTAKDFLEVLRLPHCPAHFASLDALMAYGTRYEGLEASRMMSQSQQAVGRVKMYQNTPGSTEYRLGRRIYNNGQQNIDNVNNQLNSQF